MNLIPVILCGGAGSRLWPVSRESHPKSFIRLADGQSLLQKAFIRGSCLPLVSEVLAVTNRDFAFKTKDEFEEVNTLGMPISYIFEPCGRNTAAAVAAAAIYVAERYGRDASMLVLAADHLIQDQGAFKEAVSSALLFAEKDKLVTFGIKPDRPETGFGYIEAEGNKVLRFVEKPDKKTAETYLNSGRFVWNSGMFCFKAGSILDEMHIYSPAIMEAVAACYKHSRLTTGNGFCEVDLNRKLFEIVPEDSIDYAVMEKSTNMAVVPCDIGWDDIGSWNALADLVESDADGNKVEGRAALYNTSNCYVRSDGRLVGTVGVKDLVIVDTPDALLVANKESVQDVKKLYVMLKEHGDEEYKVHRTVHRPWGTYTVLENSPGYKIKRIDVKPGAALSLQMHHHRSEHWVVVSGTAQVINGDKEFLVHTNESTYIPAGNKHRLSNPGVIELVLIEVQSGEYLGEDDIVRFDDIYGRA